MRLRCMIVDDEPYAIRLLAQHVSKITALDLRFECSNPLEALDYLKHNTVDLIFLDINMPHLNGLQLASIFSPGQKFIFTTAYSEHAVESYEKNALDYLLKPITFDRFLKAIAKVTDHFDVVKTVPENVIKEESFFIKSGKSFIQLSLSEIVLIESQKDYVVFHTAHQKHATLKTMKELEESFPPTSSVFTIRILSMPDISIR